MSLPLSAATFLAALVLSAAAALSQGAAIEFGGMKQDRTLPVEVSADSLTVNQTNGSAVFSGNVIAIQGELRLTAAQVSLIYVEGGGDIDTLTATGGVTLVNATEAAEAREAVYTLRTGSVVMTGNVLLTQGQNAISGQKLVIDLNTGTGVMEGRVQTVFTPAKPAAQGN
ncbi:MAG: lipopolysaccharide transport periplasmic protein LptA [Gemmobacter sp.]